MNLKSIILLTVISGVSFTVKGQDPQFSQYYAAPLYLNPGFTGSTEQQRITVNHRVQWPELPNAFSTSSASYEFYDNKLNSGFGFLVTTDVMGSTDWRTTMVGLTYSHKTRLGKNWVFSPGLNFSYGNNGMDKSKVIMRDGLLFGDGNSYDVDINRIENSNFFDFSAGSVFYNERVWFGISAHHLNKPNISIIGDESELPVNVTAHGGVNVPLYNGPKKLNNVHYLTPSIIYRKQSQSQTVDAGLRYHIDPVAVGLWYRGIPLNSSTEFEEGGIQLAKRDSWAFIASLMFDGFQFGYSYDFSVSAKQTSTGGAHEVSLSYEFARKDRKTVKRKDMLLPCPTFLRSGIL